MSRAKTIATIALVACAVTAIVLRGHRGPWRPVEVAGLVVAVPSFILWATARLQLGRSFAIRPEARGLVTTGLYSRIRNPVYVFGSLFIAGMFALLDRPWLYLVFLIIVPMQVIRARKEAAVLEAAYGDAYRAYRARTWL